MILSKTAERLLGLATAWAVLYPVIFIGMMLLMVLGMGLTMETSGGEPPPLFMVGFFGIFPIHCLSILLQIVLSAVYLIHVIKNDAAAETVRILLGLGFFFLPFIAMPLYYYLYIWLDTPPEWAVAPDGPKLDANDPF